MNSQSSLKKQCETELNCLQFGIAFLLELPLKVRVFYYGNSDLDVLLDIQAGEI